MKTTTSDVSASHDDQFTTDTATLGPSTGPRGAEPLGPRSVWGPPLLKSVFAAFSLMLVAYLGHLSHQLETYGPIRRLDEQVIRLVDAAHTTPQPSIGTRSPDSQANADQELGVVETVEPQTQNTKKPGCPDETATPILKGILPDGRVVLNDASTEEFTTLPGIGPARANAIVELRTRLKKFKKVEDLLRIKGIGWKSLAKLKDRVVVDRPIESPVEAGTNTPPAPNQAPLPRTKVEKQSDEGPSQGLRSTEQIVASMGNAGS